MTNAARLIEAVELLKEVATGEAETCIRGPLVEVGAILTTKHHSEVLKRAGRFMTDFAHGLAPFDQAQAHIDGIKLVARCIEF